MIKIIYDHCYLSEKALNEVYQVFGHSIEFVHADNYRFDANFPFPMTDRISILNEIAGNYVRAFSIANDKVDFARRFPSVSPKTVIGKLIMKPVNGRDSIGVKLIGSGIVQEYVEGHEGVVCCWRDGDGDIQSVSARIKNSGNFMSEDFKRLNEEDLICGCNEMIDSCEMVYSQLEIDRMCRFDVKGDKILEANFLGGLGMDGLMWKCFKANKWEYKDFLKTVLGIR